MNADGSNQTNLTNDPAFEMLLGQSPDGRKLMFIVEGDDRDGVYVMNADGSDKTLITRRDLGLSFFDPIARIDWSPGSKKIAFSAEDEGNYEIYVIDADGSNQTSLTNDLTDDTCPRWSNQPSYNILPCGP